MEEKYTTKEGYEIHKKDYFVEVFYKGKKFLTWDDEANVDYPEDLIWHRDISRIFDAGIKLGLELAKDKE